ncbi:uncharacterized protein LOC130700820 [Daphnia carinata]|uniref:uncharacterized protein LOC130700820 n=1 Tax=Daphnia carinata TaxID=120202 RepID=UPI00257D1DE6|nr:uncharacterized protein LOC130700820 [Daphnia carinata]
MLPVFLIPSNPLFLKMKFLIVAATLLVASASASVLRAKGLSDCGAGGSPISFEGQLLTQTAPVVGRMFMDLTTTTLVDATAEANLQVRKVTTRIADNYEVPCLNGISGTCTVEFCTALTTYPDAVCTLFPADVPCSCPLAAAVYANPSAYVTFTSEWLGIEGGVNGDYITRTEIVSNLGTPEETILGCLLLEYALVAV